MSPVRTVPRRIVALLLPALEPWPCHLLSVDEPLAVAGGGRPVEELFTGAVEDGVYRFYGRRADVVLPDNPRAAVLAARLGFTARDVQRRLRGDVVVVGVSAAGTREVDVPDGVVSAVRVSGVRVLAGGDAVSLKAGGA